MLEFEHKRERTWSWKPYIKSLCKWIYTLLLNLINNQKWMVEGSETEIEKVGKNLCNSSAFDLQGHMIYSSNFST